MSHIKKHDYTRKYLFILSYDYPELSVGEALATLKAEGVIIDSYIMINRCLIVYTKSKTKYIILASKRSAVIKEVSIIHGIYSTDIDFKSMNLDLLRKFKTFGVRVKKIQSKKNNYIDKNKIERIIGDLILKYNPNSNVDLKSPDLWIMIYYLEGIAMFSSLVSNSTKKDFIERRPRKRPVFVSSTLHPKIARTLVNLSQVKKGDKIYDPFCGIGGILIEGGLLEIDTIGSEISYTRVIGAKKNLEWQSITNSELILADSLLLPIKKVDAVVTDIPYGRSTFTQGYSVSDIYMKLLMICSEMLKINGFLVVLHPKENIFHIPSNLNLRIMEEYEIPVHRSLTRIITVYKRVN